VSLRRWQELAGKTEPYEDLHDLFLQEKFIKGIAYDRAKFVLEREPNTLQEAVKHALTHEAAKMTAGFTHSHSRPPRSPKSDRRTKGGTGDNSGDGDAKQDEGEGGKSAVNKGKVTPTTPDPAPHGKCYICQTPGHIAKFCPSLRSESSAAIVEEIGNAIPNDCRLCETCTKLPFSPECTVIVEGRKSVGLRDTGSSLSIVQTSLVPEHCQTGRIVSWC
jgi:hypothetical protein